jgi:hypothetical protein
MEGGASKTFRLLEGYNAFFRRYFNKQNPNTLTSSKKTTTKTKERNYHSSLLFFTMT